MAHLGIAVLSSEFSQSKCWKYILVQLFCNCISKNQGGRDADRELYANFLYLYFEFLSLLLFLYVYQEYTF